MGSVGTRAADAGQRLHVEPCAVAGKAAEDDASERRCAGQRRYRRGGRNICGTVGRKTKRAGRNGGESDRGKRINFGKLDRTSVTGGELVVLALSATVPDRPNRMDDMASWQLIATGNLSVTR
jgi:hypothetical protein